MEQQYEISAEELNQFLSELKKSDCQVAQHFEKFLKKHLKIKQGQAPHSDAKQQVAKAPGITMDRNLPLPVILVSIICTN